MHHFGDIQVLKLPNLETQVKGHSRSLEMTLSDSLYMISYYRPIVTLCLDVPFSRYCDIYRQKNLLHSYLTPLRSEVREYPHKPYFSRKSIPGLHFCC